MSMTPKIEICAKPGLILPNSYQPTSAVMPEVEPKTIVSPEDIPEEIKEEEKTLFEIQKDLLKKNAKNDSWGFVQKSELKAMKEIVNKSLGFEPPIMSGYHIGVVIYEGLTARTTTGEKSIIQLADSIIAEERFRNPVGLVVSMGPECYRGRRFEEHWAVKFLRKYFNKWMPECQKKTWCNIGDWVIVARHEGPMINYRGKPILLLPDTKIYAVVENPDYVWRD